MTSPSNSTGQSELTPREAEVLDLARRGYTNNEIAERLGITRNAVRFHLKEVHSKLGTGSERSVLARGWSRAIGFLAMPAAKFGVPATLATAIGSIAITGFAAYKALPAGSSLAGPERFEGSVTIDGRYPNGCPAEYDAGTMSLEDFAYGGTTLEELRALNPLWDGYASNQAKIRVPYNPNQTCSEATALSPTPPGSPPKLGTPPAATPTSASSASLGKFIVQVSPPDGFRVTQESTRSAAGTANGACALVEFDGPAENGQWFRLWFDGDDVTSKATWVIPGVQPTRGRLCYAPEDGLEPGHHNARIVVQDPSGSGPELDRFEWSFEVLN